MSPILKTLNLKNLLYFVLSGIVLFSVFVEGCSKKSEKVQSNPVQIILPDTLAWSVRMADSEIFRRKDYLEFGGSNPKAKWNYQTGLFLKALLDVGNTKYDPKYLTYVKKVVDSFLDADGRIKTYKMEDYNIDKINSGKVLLALYRSTKLEKYKKAADILRKQLDNHPRTAEGGFWHKKRYPWQMWLDGLYMGGPFYAEYSKMFDQPAGYDDVVQQILLIDVRTRDPKTGLRYHGWDESNKQAWANPENGCSPHFWARGMGWYTMALVDILDFLPVDYAARDKILFVFRDLAKSIITYQDKSGLWYQVLDQGQRSGNYLESSASSMFVYALAKGVNRDYLNDSYWQNAQKGYNALIREKVVVGENGLVSLKDICSVAGLGGNPYRDGSFDYYVSEPIVKNDLKGVGPFIMASLQMEKQ